MSTENPDISLICFQSTTFPTEEDMKLWRTLTPAQQQAVIDRDIQEGLKGLRAARQTQDEIVSAVLAEYAAYAV